MVFTQERFSKIRQGGVAHKASSDLPLPNLFCPRCRDRLLIPYKQDTAICYSCGWGATLPACLTHAEARQERAGERDYISEERRAA